MAHGGDGHGHGGGGHGGHGFGGHGGGHGDGHGFGGHGHGLGGHGHGDFGGHGGHGHGHGDDHDSMGHAYHGGAFNAHGCHGHSGFHYGHLNHALAFMGVTEGCEDGAGQTGRRVRLPGIATNDRSVQALVWPHGACDPESLVKCLMRKHGFVDIAFKRRDCAPTYKMDNEIRDTTPFDGQMFNSPMPSGYHRGATGYTRSWRYFWQIPAKKYWWSAPEVDVEEPVYMILTGSMWFFNEIGDYETRVLLTAVSRPRLNHGMWQHREDLIQKYTMCAKIVALELVERLRDCDPSVSSVTQRRVQARAEELLAQADEQAQNAGDLLARNGSRGVDEPVDGPVPPRIRPVDPLPDPMLDLLNSSDDT